MPKITSDIVAKTPAPAKGGRLIFDAGHADAIRGFAVRIFMPTRLHPSGARSFVLSYRVAGVEKRITIGTYPVWSVTAARAEAKELRRRIDQGEDPALTKAEARTAPRVRDLVDRYVRDHLPKRAAGPGGKRHRDERRMLAEIAAHLGEHRRVVDIHYGDVEHLHKKITESGRPIRANRILAVCSTMFSLALRPLPGEAKAWRGPELGNPCKGIPRNPEHGRERFFSTAELTALSEALAEYGDGKTSAGNCISFIMTTGCRPNEAMLARWTELDSEPGYWCRPSAHMKARKTHRVPLNPAAAELVDRLRKRRGSSPFVFPGNPQSKPMRDLTRCWDQVRKQAKVEGRIYDLRHSFASIGAGGGLSLLVIGRLLGHTQSKTTSRYAHLADDPLREATNRIGAVIAGKPGAEVTRIGKARS
jgi:integrase